MSTGAVISINYDYLHKSFSPIDTSGNADIFSSILDPLKKAKSIGKSIKTELGNIALELDVTTTIGKFLSPDDGTVNSLASVSESAKLARNDEEVVYGALTNIEDKIVDFGNTVVDVDSKASRLISHRKLDFNQRYPWLESDSEYRTRMNQRSGWEKAGDFCHGFFKGGIVGGFDSLFNGREKFDQHYEAIKQKIAEFASNTWEWVKENWEAIVAAVIVVVAAIVAICTFGAGTVFLVASLAAFAYAVADKIVAINNNGKGIVATLEENGFHHLSQFFKGLNWGLQISMLISGFAMGSSTQLFKGGAAWLNSTKAANLLKGFSLFKSSGFLATVGNGAIFGGGYNFIVDLTAYLLNFSFSGDAQSNPLEYLKTAIKDTLVDTALGFVVGGAVSGISYSVIHGFSFLKNKLISFNKSNSYESFKVEVTKQTQVNLDDVPDDIFGTFKTDNGGMLSVTKGNGCIEINVDKQTAELMKLSDKSPTILKHTTKIDRVTNTSYKIVFEQPSFSLESANRMSNNVSLPGAKKSAAALGKDGLPIDLHHITPENKLTVYVELDSSIHEQMTGVLHSNIGYGESFRNNPILEKQFNNFKNRYWQDRLYRALENYTGSNYGRSSNYLVFK